MANIYRHFRDSARRFESKDAVWFFEKDEKRTWSYGDLLHKVDALAEGLHEIGLRSGDRLGVIAANGPYWPVLDFALAREGIVLVPVHTTLSEAQVRGIFSQSRIKAVFFGPGSEPFLPGLKTLLPATVTHAIFLDSTPPEAKGVPFQSLLWSDLMERGEAQLRSGSQRPLPEVKDSDISTLMYTSGTTGEMKGVLLTHGNLTHNAIYGEKLVGGKPGHVLLSILPLSHAFERVAGLLGPLFIGSTVVYGRGIPYISDDLKKIRPHHLNVVPRLLEKMYEGIQNKVKEKGAAITRLFRSTTASSAKYLQYRQSGSAMALLYWWPHQLAEFLFYKKLRKQLGGNIDRFISGGAALDPKIWSFFTAAGFKVLEGYGLTECSPIVAASPGDRPKLGSVGLPLAGVEVRIGPNEEVLVRGPNLMVGYENNPQATQEAIDAEGWFHSGDQGYVDEEGYLYIKGRVKEMIVTSYGKNIIPTVIERALETSPLIHQAVVFGHNRPYLAALLVLQPEEIKKLAQRLGVDPSSPQIRDEVEKQVERQTQDLAHHERVKKFIILSEELNQDRDFLTPTLKLKRKKISEHYQREIESMYS